MWNNYESQDYLQKGPYLLQQPVSAPFRTSSPPKFGGVLGAQIEDDFHSAPASSLPASGRLVSFQGGPAGPRPPPPARLALLNGSGWISYGFVRKGTSSEWIPHAIGAFLPDVITLIVNSHVPHILQDHNACRNVRGSCSMWRTATSYSTKIHRIHWPGAPLTDFPNWWKIWIVVSEAYSRSRNFTDASKVWVKKSLNSTTCTCTGEFSQRKFVWAQKFFNWIS